jgi:hypothetical protein
MRRRLTRTRSDACACMHDEVMVQPDTLQQLCRRLCKACPGLQNLVWSRFLECVSQACTSGHSIREQEDRTL